MAKNPDPSRITDEMWQLWEEAKRIIERVELGGIYADKKGYHNTVNANKVKWPDNYSIELIPDLKGPRDKARGIDLTPDLKADMWLLTKRCKDSALDPADYRLNALREFYGTLDGKNVYGLIKDSLNGTWARSTADETHLWHWHGSVFTEFIDNWNMLSPIVSVWSGESLAQWEDTMTFPKKGDSGEEVQYWQRVHNSVRGANPTKVAPIVAIDGDYGTATENAFAYWARNNGASSEYPGTAITGWLAHRYHLELGKLYYKALEPVLPVADEKLEAFVSSWLDKKFADKSLVLNGEIDGRITLS